MSGLPRDPAYREHRPDAGIPAAFMAAAARHKGNHFSSDLCRNCGRILADAPGAGRRRYYCSDRCSARARRHWRRWLRSQPDPDAAARKVAEEVRGNWPTVQDTINQIALSVLMTAGSAILEHGLDAAQEPSSAPAAEPPAVPAPAPLPAS